MILVEVKLIPNGVGPPRELGKMIISNDGTGSSETGNYLVTIFKGEKYTSNPGVFRRGVVKGFARLTLGPWDLLKRALDDALKGRG